MLATLIHMAASVGQTSVATQAQWFTLTNQPGWQGYGVLNASGWVIPEKFRRVDSPAVEVPPAIVQNTAVNVQNATMSAPVNAPVNVQYGDPYGFTAWLNATRAGYGLGAVGYDANLTNWAGMNNNQQAARGMGHFVLGPARRQNAAMGAFENIGSMWLNSPAHRAALLDPTITAIGIAGLGAYWTFNAY